jgi:hypothetical protein
MAFLFFSLYLQSTPEMQDGVPAEISGQSADHGCMQTCSGALPEMTSAMRGWKALTVPFYPYHFNPLQLKSPDMQDGGPAKISGQTAVHACMQTYSGALPEMTSAMRGWKALAVPFYPYHFKPLQLKSPDMQDGSPAEISGQSADHGCMQTCSGALPEMTRGMRGGRP